MTRLAICGIRGRMGQAVLRLAREHAEVDIIGGIGREAGEVEGVPVSTIDAAHDILTAADVVIDFSTPEATTRLLGSDLVAGRALVIGTTGLGTDVDGQVDAKARDSAVLVAANFSLGVNLLLSLTKRAARALPADTFDIEIVEAHHRRKKDAPSGTALALAGAVAAGRAVELEKVRRDGRSGADVARTQGEVTLHAVRAGGIVGEHRVLFGSDREVIELRHEALDRAVFAEGALTAALWLAGRSPGRYTMGDVLGIGED